jgi:hypothetical protein
VCSHLSVPWQKSGFTEPDGKSTTARKAVESCLSGMSPVKSSVESGAPCFVFFGTGKKAGGRPSKEAAASAEVRSMFGPEGKDLKLYIAARFFNCISVDVTGVDKKTSGVLCSDNAPIIVLTDKEGKVAAMLAGSGQCKERNIYSAMCSTLGRCGYRNVSTTISKLEKLMKKELYGAERTLMWSGDGIAICRSAISAVKHKKGSESSRKRAIKKQEAGIEKIKSQVAEAKETKYKVFKAEYDLLKAAGLPDDRLPKEPKAPKKAKK